MYRGIRGSIEDRFWKYIVPEPNTGCWLWDGSSCKGYGVISVGGNNGKQRLATHVALELHAKPKPAPGLQACHHCDVTWCVNPDHLYWGTGSQNALDSFRRERRFNHQRGSDHTNSKLTENDVRYIRASTKLHKQLAAEFSVCRQLITDIKRGQRWKHVQ